MVKIIAAVIFLIIAVAAVALVTQPNNTDQEVPTVTPTTAPPNGEEESAMLPSGWTRGYDEVFNYEFAYPEDFDFQPATPQTGESVLYSFDIEETPDTGGVPSNELKIGVVFFPPDDPREITYDESNVTSEETITVDSHEATRRTVESGAGGNISTEVETDQGTYLISAYPPDSEHLEVYDQFLDFVQLNVEQPTE